MSPPIQYRGTSTVRCEGKMTLNKNKRLVAKEQQVIASDSSLPCKVFFFVENGKKRATKVGQKEKRQGRWKEKWVRRSVEKGK